mgnify:CR=1 FL=1|jgi:hypothetical protein
MEEIPIEPKKDNNFELPWCPTCLGYTKYLNSSGTIQRPNLDGGTFSEVVETRKCLECDGFMVFVSECKFLVWFVRILAFGMWFVLNISLFYLFEIQTFTWIILIFSTLIFFIAIKTPSKTLKILKNWKSSKESKFLELLTGHHSKDEKLNKFK